MNKNVKKVMMMLFLVGFTFVILSGNVFADGTANCNTSTEVECGGVCVPKVLTNIITTVINIIKIGVPIILIILGMIDMGKAVASQKEDEIKKGQKTLISRVIAAAIVFFVVAIVQLMMSIIDSATNNNTEGSATQCLNTIFNGTSSTTNNTNNTNNKNNNNKGSKA